MEAGNGATGGYMTADVSNLDSLKLLADVQNNGIAGTAMALNGSGLGIAVGGSSFVFGVLSLARFDGGRCLIHDPNGILSGKYRRPNQAECLDETSGTPDGLKYYGGCRFFNHETAALHSK